MGPGVPHPWGFSSGSCPLIKASYRGSVQAFKGETGTICKDPSVKSPGLGVMWAEVKDSSHSLYVESEASW